MPKRFEPRLNHGYTGGVEGKGRLASVGEAISKEPGGANVRCSSKAPSLCQNKMLQVKEMRSFEIR